MSEVGQDTALAVVEAPAGGALSQMEEWTPEQLRAMIKREVELREVIIDYYRSQMREGQHYYKRSRFSGRKDDDKDGKPSLTKEGALNLAHLLKVRPAEPEVFETHHPDGHYTVRTRVKLVSLRSGAVVAEGEGLCTSYESKYAWRWVGERYVPKEDRELYKSRYVAGKGGGDGYTQYRLPNEDLADLFNTILKLSFKRGLVAAALVLPLVSEIFTQDLEDMGGGSGEEAGGQGSGRPPQGRQAPAPQGGQGSGSPPAAHQPLRRTHSVICAEARRLIREKAPGEGPGPVQERRDLIKHCWDVEGYPAVEHLPLSKIEAGLAKLKAIKPEQPPVVGPPERGVSAVGLAPEQVPSVAEARSAGPAAGEEEEEAPEIRTPPEAPRLGPDGFVVAEDLDVLYTWAEAQAAEQAVELAFLDLPGYPELPEVRTEVYQAAVQAVIHWHEGRHPLADGPLSDDDVPF